MGVAHLRALIGAAAVFIAATAAAHELGTTRVNAHFRADHTYAIDVVTARHPSKAALEKGTEIRFDDVVARPRIDIFPNGTIRYFGNIPPRVATFTWRYDLTYAAYALSVESDGDAQPATQWLEGSERSYAFALAKHVVPPTALQTARQYLALGFTHILPYGLDHILFVLGLFLLTTKIRPVIAQVTTFTVAHSITLALTMYGLVSLPARIVEPLIALSIVYIAAENLFVRTLSSRRLAVIFGFGLLHGMGFAGVLRELGLPRDQFVTALVTFNVGVEIAQLTVIAAATLLFAYWHREKAWYRPRFAVPASLAIALTGAIWTVARIV